VEESNRRREFARYGEAVWRPLERGADGTAGPDNAHARFPPELRRVFPHPLTARSDRLLLASLACTPYSDELVASFAAELITREELGRRGVTDYLSVSLAATDYIGHAWGPESAEYRDNLLRLDATLAGLLKVTDQLIGADRCLVVLSADHGVDDIPEARLAAGRAAGRFDPAVLRTGSNRALRAALGVDADLVTAFVPPGFHLDHERIRSLGLGAADVADALVAHLVSQPGVMAAYTRERVLRGEGPPTAIFGRVRRSVHPTRSGDVVIVQAPHWYLYPDATGYAAMHGSPHDYDTFVPLLFAGAGLRPREVGRPVDPGSIAPTIAALLGARAPSGCSAPVLEEIVAGR
jgi:arylsulfatase A-like enzyme